MHTHNKTERPLDGRRALVTGASRGIGAEIARAMARAGAAVVLAARDADALARVAENITDEGGHAVIAPTDVSDPAAVQRMVAIAEQELAGRRRQQRRRRPPTADAVGQPELRAVSQRLGGQP